MVSARDLNFLQAQLGVLKKWMNLTSNNPNNPTFTLLDQRILFHLYDQETQRLTDIANDLNIAKSSASKSVARLEDAGLVSRALSQKSTIVIDLTPTFRSKLSQVYKRRQAVFEKTLTALAFEDRAAFFKGLTLLAQFANEAGLEDGPQPQEQKAAPASARRG